MNNNETKKEIKNSTLLDMKKELLDIKEKIKNMTLHIKNKYSYLVKPFFIFLIIYFIAMYPIFRANFNYIDDIGRVNFGYKGWEYFSRFTSEYLSSFVHSSDYLTDISPLPQILAILIISLSSVILIHLFKKDKKKIGMMYILSVIPLGLCPYFLECLSYKFDSIYMALSILVSVFPFLLYDKTNSKKIMFCIVNVIGTIIMCTSYQASSGIVPLITLFLSYKYWNNKENKEAIHLLCLSLLSYILGLLIFKLFIMIPVSTYVSNSIFPIEELIPRFFSNLKNYYNNVLNDFREVWLVLISGIIFCYYVLNIKYSKHNKIVSSIVLFLLVILCGCLAFGIYPMLKKPLFAPRAMYGIGILISLLAINAINIEKGYISKILVICLTWCFFTFAFTYGNALSEQKRYIDFRVQSVVNDLNHMEVMNTDSIKYIMFKGSAGSAPMIENMPSDYRTIIKRLIPQSFGDSWNWDLDYFTNYFKIKNIRVIYKENSKVPENLQIFTDTMYYTIETNNENYILVTLK